METRSGEFSNSGVSGKGSQGEETRLAVAVGEGGSNSGPRSGDGD